MAGEHRGQNLPDLFRCPVVGQFTAGLTPNSTMTDFISNSAILTTVRPSTVLAAAAGTSPGREKMAEFSTKLCHCYGAVPVPVDQDQVRAITECLAT